MPEQAVKPEIRLRQFEGPLDLLLHLIEKNDVDIYDIPISTITAQYMQYIMILTMLQRSLIPDSMGSLYTVMRLRHI